jgi:RNA polymerase sigma factor (TIGR02999 family)
MLAAGSRSAKESILELLRSRQGESPVAGERLYSELYGELRLIARRMRRRAGAPSTLSTTAVVHESYLKLVGAAGLDFADRAHFLNTAARAMRQILLDGARRRLARKRGGGADESDLDDVGELAIPHLEVPPEDLLALGDALVALERVDERLARVVELRYFAGLSEEESAEALGVTDRTVRRDWRKARAFLLAELSGRPALQLG